MLPRAPSVDVYASLRLSAKPNAATWIWANVKPLEPQARDGLSQSAAAGFSGTLRFAFGQFDLFGTLGEQLPILLLVVRDMILACLRKTCWLCPLAHFGEMLSFRISH